MVWSLIPSDPLSGDEKYYIYAKGSYKVGRKGCDVIINNDKGVSRIHAEIILDTMEAMDPVVTRSSISSKVRIRDCSKYGTFIARNSTIKEKVHECPGRETYLKNGDLVSFGTGNASYRFCFVPLKFYLCSFTNSQIAPSTQDRVASIGASVTHSWTPECTHVIVDPFMPVSEEIVDAIVAKKPLVLSTWLEFVAANKICNEIPSGTSYVPTLTFDGASVTVADIPTRENCLKGYTFLLDSTNMYKFRERMPLLLEAAGAKVCSYEDFDSGSQNVDNAMNRLALVTPAASADRFHQKSSLSKINEISLISAVISGHLDPSTIVSPSIVVSSSCSTDETVVADSDVETETATSEHPTIRNAIYGGTHHGIKQPIFNEHAITSEATPSVEFKQQNKRTILREDDMQATEYGSREDESPKEDNQSMKFVEPNRAVVGKKEDNPEIGNVDILYSQNLIVRDTNPKASTGYAKESGVVNFKRFRKTNVQPGNSFTSLVPFSKYPYTDSDYDKEVIESVKEEKKRKQTEAVAEDLFNNEKGRRRGVAGALQGLLGCGSSGTRR